MSSPQPVSEPDQAAWTAIRLVMAETLTSRVARWGDEISTTSEAGAHAATITDDVVARLSPTIPEDSWIPRRRRWPFGTPHPHQEAWIAIDAVVEEALNRYVVEQGMPITSPEEAGLLADRIAEDVTTRLRPTVTEDRWTGNP